MLDRLNQLMARAKRSGSTFAVLYMDTDHFKDVNDSYGHEFGDLLLRAVAKRLTKSVRQSDTVARIGGDEFVIILEAAHEIRDAETVTLRVQRALATSFNLERHRVKAAVSIGLSFYPANGADADTLLRAADYAMYLAKREGGNRHITCLPSVPHPGDVIEKE
jgi:diguanylate cyclase (GGDEF)-like protein